MVGARILVADDEPDVLALIVLKLERAGYQVLTARAGDTAPATRCDPPRAGARARSSEPGYQRISAAAQVNPAPNAAVITSIPGFRRPSATASASATGIDAALLFP